MQPIKGKASKRLVKRILADTGTLNDKNIKFAVVYFPDHGEVEIVGSPCIVDTVKHCIPDIRAHDDFKKPVSHTSNDPETIIHLPQPDEPLEDKNRVQLRDFVVEMMRTANGGKPVHYSDPDAQVPWWVGNHDWKKGTQCGGKSLDAAIYLTWIRACFRYYQTPIYKDYSSSTSDNTSVHRTDILMNTVSTQTSAPFSPDDEEIVPATSSFETKGILWTTRPPQVHVHVANHPSTTMSVCADIHTEELQTPSCSSSSNSGSWCDTLPMGTSDIQLADINQIQNNPATTQSTVAYSPKRVICDGRQSPIIGSVRKKQRTNSTAVANLLSEFKKK